jgi:RNA polymerase sigma-70 factor (ECF subfamily)
MDSGRHKVDTEIENMEAFDALCSAYLDLVYRYIIYQVRERATAEDLTRKTLLNAWKSRGEDKCDGAQFSAWLYRIAQNHIVE